MVQLRQIHSANDNAPLKSSFYGKLNFRPNPVIAQTSNGASSTPRPSPTARTYSHIGWAAPILAALLGFYAIWQQIPLANLLWPSLILGTLLFFTAAKSPRYSRLRNFSGLLMVGAFTTALAAFLSQNGFTLIGMELTLLIACLALFVGWTFKSEPAVILSGFMSLIYLANSYPELGLMSGLTDQTSRLGEGLLPWIILGQVILSQKLKSPIILLVSLIAGYLWLGTLLKSMPVNAMIGVGFVMAAAHYALGKLWSEIGHFGANIHRSFAWIIAIASALYIQADWLNVEAGQAIPFWPPNNLWLSLIGAAMLTLFVVSLMRYKNSHISLFGIFIVCAVALIIPMATVKPDVVHAVFDTIPGLNARPGLGLIIGAIVIASGFIWLIQGLKRVQVFDMVLGAGAIGIEALVLFQPDRFNADLGVIFIFSLICALCVGGLIAGITPERNPSIGNYA